MFDRPIRAVAGSESAELTSATACSDLIIGNPRDEAAWGTGLLPKECLVNWSRQEWRERCARRHRGDLGRRRRRASAAQRAELQEPTIRAARKWQADTLDFVWLDEEPPIEIYSEALTRISSTGGMVFCDVHAIVGDVRGVPALFARSRRPTAPSISMTIDDAPHYSAEQKEKIVAGYPPHEREARAKGIPALGSGRIFPITEEEISIPARIFPREFARIRGMRLRLRPSVRLRRAGARSRRGLRVRDARVQTAADARRCLHAAAIRAWGSEWVPIAWPHDGLAADKGSGEELAAQYRAQHLAMLPERSTFEDGKSSGVEAGLMLMLDRMQTGRLKVFSHLNDWYEEFRLYHRKDGKVVKEHDDLLSATRYALMMLRFAQTEPNQAHAPAPYRVMASSLNTLGEGEDTPLSGLGNAFETAAYRQRQAVRPEGGRQEGPATFVLENYLPHLFGGLATLPQRAIQSGGDLYRTGQYDPGPTLETMGLMMGARSPFMAQGDLGIFGGLGAATANVKMYNQARRMEEKVSPQSIWNQTRWYRAPTTNGALKYPTRPQS